MNYSLKLGDKVSYQLQIRFCLRSWKCRRYVKAGDVGVVVEEGSDTRPWVEPGDMGKPTWWNVDFGEGRVVTINSYSLQIGQYRHEVTKAFSPYEER